MIEDKERTPCEVWTRVMGYFRPLSGYNKGKVAEYNERKFFSEEKVRQNLGKIKKTKTQVIEK